MTKKITYNHILIEKSIQKKWDKEDTYKTENPKNRKLAKKPFYVLDMFPYPSGSGLHVGHPRGYIGSDVYARFKRMQGYNVLHPMGFDAFGLPAEQYAIQTGKHPSIITNQSIKNFKKQLSGIGFSDDWDREIKTIDPSYYKWTQVIFLKIYNSFFDTKKQKARHIDELVKVFEKEGNSKINEYTAHGEVEIFSKIEWRDFSKKEKQDVLMKYRMAYEGYAEVNWCKELGTVLANDEVLEKDGRLVSERGDFLVEKKSMRQWFMRISAYGDRLISGLGNVDFPESTKEIQKNWIGRSEGSEIDFEIKIKDQNNKYKIKVFTTRADTLFGVTYVVLAPEHNLVNELLVNCENKKDIERYIERVKNKTQDERTENKEKTGIELSGVYAINPVNNEQVPVWIGDYVLLNYGTGAVMAVPAHDERDFEFAKKYNLSIKNVIDPIFVRSDAIGRNDFKKKNKIVSIVEDLEGNILSVNWGHLGGRLFLGGTIEEGESPEETALRELAEESGYVDAEIIDVGDEVFDYKYFAISKGTAHQAYVKYVHIKLRSLKQKAVSLEEDEKGKFIIEWVSKRQAQTEVVDPLHVYAFNKFVIKTSFNKDGIVGRSGNFNGVSSAQARKEITKFVKGKLVTKYKMRDAIFARQRYWGEPIPLIHDKKTGLIKEVPLSKLPLVLPNTKSYKPTGNGDSPLAGIKSWADAGYETNTMPGWAGSSWYFLRYMDPQNSKDLVGDQAINYWKNVDMYIGGAEHNTGHLLYARFWHKVLFDLGITKTQEPFKALRHQGMIGGSDGRKMSKRWGNVVNPDDVVKTYGADTLRVFEMFLGPFDGHLPWSEEGIIGSRRFIERVWRLGNKILLQDKNNPSSLPIVHKTIQKVNVDISNFNFNTAISSMMICLNEMEKQECVNKKDFKMFLQVLAPFAPYIADELWLLSDEKQSIHQSIWPKHNPKLLIEKKITIGVQINGKFRGEIKVDINTNEQSVYNIVSTDLQFIKYLENPVKKIIYIQNKIINILT